MHSILMNCLIRKLHPTIQHMKHDASIYLNGRKLECLVKSLLSTLNLIYAHGLNSEEVSDYGLTSAARFR